MNNLKEMINKLKKNKISSVFFVCFIFLSEFCFSQGLVNNEDKIGRINEIKTGYLTKELKLTQGESKKFWPVYREYRSDVQEVRRSNRDNEIHFEEAVVEIKKDYRSKFYNILHSEDRVNKVFSSEKHFREMLKAELKRRRIKKITN